MICNRCGVINKPGKIACVQCMARLDPAAADQEGLHCQDHPDVMATGKCLACGKLVCDNCGGVINNRAVYCMDHAALAMSGALLGGSSKGGRVASAVPPPGAASPGMPPGAAPGAAALPPDAMAAGAKPHRGGLILGLGIFGFFCCPTALAAAIMGSLDVKAMDAGAMDPSGRGLTNAGRWIGVGMIVLTIVVTILQGAAIMALIQGAQSGGVPAPVPTPTPGP